MKLSEAIRLGAMLRPQTSGSYFGMTEEGIGSCALGAAFEAAFGSNEEVSRGSIEYRLEETFPIIRQVGLQLLAEIARRNDVGWSREKVADWVESIENRIAPAAHVVSVEATELVTT